MRWFLDTQSAAVDFAAASRSVSHYTHGEALAHSQASPDDNEMTISQMAERYGITMRTLRFYESKGLLAPRRVGNRRFYNDACRARLNLILKGKAMGLALDEITELVSLVESDLSDGDRADAVKAICERQQDILVERRAMIEGQMAETEQAIAGLSVV